MKKKNSFSRTIRFVLFLVFGLMASTPTQAFGLLQDQDQESVSDFSEYSGIITDSKTNKPLVFATLSIANTNISTITNADGNFLLKVPKNLSNVIVEISFLGYQKKVVPINQFKTKNNKIELDPATIELSEINIKLPQDARALVISTLSKRAENNLNDPTLMTAFYRETIKRRRKNVSIAEAVVNLYKAPYNSTKRDRIKLFKSRKSTDYSRLDTVALKLQGGPFNALYVDVMKYPEYIFTSDMIDLYDFSFDPSTTINERPVYVIRFKQRSDIEEPLYYGKLFIDSETWALTSAIYNLNVENRALASGLFVRKKPKDVQVYPTVAAYRVDYREKQGKWYYGYSNVQLSFKINKKRKLFNTTYSLTSEMAVTDWERNMDGNLKPKDRLRPSIIISDEASGFSDPEFWGAYNVIEPEKSIESAISKIKRQLRKTDKGGKGS